MNKKYIISDFDGVIGNSLPTCLNVSGQIVSLFNPKAQITSFKDYRKHLGNQEGLTAFEKNSRSTFREMHRLLMRYNAPSIELFNEVLSVYSKLAVKPMIVSSSYTDTITSALGNKLALFAEVYGCDKGEKETTLLQLKERSPFIYVTDTKTDIKRCQAIGVTVIATTWGYDTADTLSQVNPDYLVEDAQALLNLFYHLQLIN